LGRELVSEKVAEGAAEVFCAVAAGGRQRENFAA